MATGVDNDLVHINALDAVLDLTEALSVSTEMVLRRRCAIFNPSLARTDKLGEYIVAYRYTGLKVNEIYANSQNVSSAQDPRHPWRSNWINDVDGTGFIKATIGYINGTWCFKMNNRIVVENGGDRGQKNKIEVKDGSLFGVDTRIYYDAPLQRYILTYNTWSDKKTPPSFDDNGLDNAEIEAISKLSSQCQSGWCGHIDIAFATLDAKKKKLTTSSSKHACPVFAKSLEKNWTVWRMRTDPVENGLRLSYGLSPTHTYFESTTSTKFARCSKSESPVTFFGQIEQLYKPAMAFSLSTPAIALDGRSRNLISVGHLKVNFNKLQTFPELQSLIDKLDVFINGHSIIGDHLKHKDYYYFMFFYEFDRTDGTITRFSPMFLPYNSEPYSVFFAAGLEMYDKNHVLLSYGVGDVNAKVAIMNKSKINALLNYPQNVIKFAILSTMDLMPINALGHPTSPPVQEQVDMDTTNPDYSSMDYSGGKGTRKYTRLRHR